MIGLFETVARDLLYALRTMRTRPAFTMTAVLTLALGIGANTAVFSVVRAVLLKPLEYRDPERLVLLSGGATPAHFEELRTRSRSYSDVGAFGGAMEKMTLSGRREPEVLSGARVSANFLQILGVKPIRGRSFLPKEDRPGAPSVAMIGSELWKRRFAGDPAIVGKTIMLAAAPYTIVGVLPADFLFPFPGVDVWVTRPSEMSMLSPRSQWLSPVMGVFGRLKPHTDLQQASAELNVLNRQYALAYPRMLDAKPNQTARVKPLKEGLVSNVRSKLWMLFGAVGFVLLIACANVASLLLARATSRAREFAIRAAIGAGRARLVGQLLTESILLAFVGGALGVLLAKWSLRGLAGSTTLDLPRAGEIRLDSMVLVFSVALSIFTGMLFGLVPSLSASRPDFAGVLRGSDNRAAPTGRGAWPIRLLVIAQIALSMVLLIGATLLMESVAHLNGVDPGFEPGGLLTMRISLAPARYVTDQKKAAFFDELVSSVESIPGVQSAAVTLTLPMTGWAGSPVQISERAPVNFNERPIAIVESITPDYFRTLKIPLKRGREFTAHDKADTQRVAIIDETLARRFWPEYPNGPDPIGQHILVGIGQAAEIVGIVADIRQSALDADPRPGVFAACDQAPQQSVMFAVRTTGDPMRLVNTVRSKVSAIDRDQAISAVKTMDDIVEASEGQRRLMTTLLGLFAGVAVLLALVGLYGVIAYSVVQRTKEMGIRRALGAQRNDILSLVVGQGLALSLAGVLLGICGAVALTRVMKGLLFHVSATDPGTFVAIALVFILVALAASYVPARRAARIDPMTALRVG